MKHGPKPITRKTFHVVIPSPHDAEAMLDFMWGTFGDHDFRMATTSSKVVTHAEVRDDDLHLVIDYTVRGGHPADLRRWLREPRAKISLRETVLISA